MKRSSFVRKGAAAASDLGTRPGLHGQALVSSGHADLDRILGGGLPLGTLALVLEDGSSRHHAALLRYFLAEGVASGQAVALAAAAEPPGGLALFIPPLLRRGSSAAKEAEAEQEGSEQDQYTLRIAWQYRRYLQPAAASRHTARPAGGGSGPGLAGSPPAAVGGGAAAAAAGAGDGGGRRVRIAAPEPGASMVGRFRDWCHQFDLARGLGEEALSQSNAAFLDCRGGQPAASLVSAAAGFVRSLEQAGHAAAAGGQQPPPEQQQQRRRQQQEASGVKWTVQPRTSLPPPTPVPLKSPQQVGRLAVLSLGSPDWWAGANSQAQEGAGAAAAAGWERGGGGEAGAVEGEVLRVLLQLKATVRERRCAAVVSVPAALHSAHSVARMCHLADAVLALESVADDSDIVKLAPDAASVAGLLHVRKLPALGALAPPTPEVSLFLIRNKRRRLAITPVEIDPDAEAGLAAEGAAAGAGSAAGSAASLLCGGPPKAGSSALDF